LDVANPQDAKVKKVLWKKPADRDLKLNYPTYAPKTGRCAFVGGDDRGMAIYAIDPGVSGPPRRLDRGGDDKHISGLVFSPDGRYLLFSSDRGMRK
jgi:Tol biopolymer transport system component